MADVEVKDSGKGGKKGQQKKMKIHVDFTPMVDMNMLLITFFMFCTTLSKPQTMEISMPTNDKVTEEEQNKVKASTEYSITWESPSTKITLRWSRHLIMPMVSEPCSLIVTKKLLPR